MPSSYACPGVDRKVMALAWVAMMDRPMVYHFMSPPPRMYVSAVWMPRDFHVP